MSQDKWTPEAVADILVNPRFCLRSPPVVSKEEWIKANAKLIEQRGAVPWLLLLLNNLRDVEW